MRKFNFKTDDEVKVILNEIRVGNHPLTLPQKKGLLKAYQWIRALDPGRDLHDDPAIFRLFGLAGCGKTTMAIGLKLMGLNPLYISFTNRAVGVLTSKGCTPGRTIHSVIYNVNGGMEDEETPEEARARQEYTAACLAGVPIEERPLPPPKREKLGFEARTYDEIAEVIAGHSCIVVDECSMVGGFMGRDLELCGLPIFGVGDPGQLPPVNDLPYFSSKNPDVLLTDVLRTDGDILDAAAWVRRGGLFGDLQDGEDYSIARKATEEWFHESDQILCGIHDKRRELNKHVRKLMGYSGFLPVVGEKICVVANNKQEQIYNGSLWVVTRSDQDDDYADLDLIEYAPTKDPKALEVRTGIRIHLACFLNDIKDKAGLGFDASHGSVYATWGYAITVHKAQGSEWPNVLLFDDSGVFREWSRHWAYTGATRAARKLRVVSRNGGKVAA